MTEKVVSSYLLYKRKMKEEVEAEAWRRTPRVRMQVLMEDFADEAKKRADRVEEVSF